MNRDRVLIVHPYRHVGGPDTFVTNLVRCLSRRGVAFWVLLSGERALAETLRDLRVTVVIEPAIRTLPRTRSPIRLASHFIASRRVAGLVRSLVEHHRVGVVHGVHETMWPVLTALRGTPTRRVVSVHGLAFRSPRWAGLLNTRMLARSTDRIICVSSAVRETFMAWNVPEHQLALVPSSVDLDAFRPETSGAAFRRELAIPTDALLVGTVGSVDERKGLTDFLEACAQIHQSHPQTRFVVVGHARDDGPAVQVEYLRHLRGRAAAFGLNACLSFVPARSDVPEVMAALDVLVQPSWTEAGPRAPLEAMAMKRPVVGTRIEGTAEEVVDGETGILVEPRDSGALAKATIALLDDAPRRDRMGRAGRARVEQFYSLARTADLIESVYRDPGAGAK